MSSFNNNTGFSVLATGYMGDYWDNYTGFDIDGNRVGDTLHQIDSQNVDNYPLIKTLENYIVDSVPLFIVIPVLSLIELVRNVDVTVSVEVTDIGSGIENVTLWFRVNGGEWRFRKVVFEENIWKTEIPAQTAGTLVEYYIEACDKAESEAKTDIYSYTIGKTAIES